MHQHVIHVILNFSGQCPINIIVKVSFSLIERCFRENIVDCILVCRNVFCNNCANYYKLIPTVSVKDPVRVCRDCFLSIDGNNNNTNNNGNIETARQAAPIPIQGGCRQSNATSNGSFNSPSGQKVKG